MIWEWLTAAAETLLTWILAPFPSAAPGGAGDIAAPLSGTLGQLGALNYFLPIQETVTVVVAVFALFPIFLGITLTLWLSAMLRGGSSVG